MTQHSTILHVVTAENDRGGLMQNGNSGGKDYDRLITESETP